MRRGYGVADYLNRVNQLKRDIPGIALSTDIIVGYPSETEEEFQATLTLLKEVRFCRVFAFGYSPRPATPAAGLPDDIPSSEKKRRLHELFAVQEEISLEENRALQGRTVPVLFDAASRMDPDCASGRTPCNRVVNVRGLEPAQVRGQIKPVLIASAGPHSLSGVPA
ncbi:MAG: TRAM domain-containing protein [Acidobacteriota bacterium]